MPAVASSSAASGSSPATTAAPGSLESVMLNSTNWYREKYEAAPLSWNTTLAKYAKDYASNCVWEHSGGPYGENLAAQFDNQTLAVDAWGDEEKKYNWAKAKFSHETGHFTQLVWRDTTSVGCGVVQCDTGGSKGIQGAYLVCEYWPPGNYEGEFKENVVKSGAGKNGSPSLGGASRNMGVRQIMVALVAANVLSTVML